MNNRSLSFQTSLIFRKKSMCVLNNMIGSSIFTATLILLLLLSNNHCLSVHAFKPTNSILYATNTNNNKNNKNNIVNEESIYILTSQKKQYYGSIQNLDLLRGGGAMEVEIESDDEESDDEEETSDGEEETSDGEELETQTVGGELSSFATKALSIFGDTIMTIMKLFTHLITSSSSSSSSSSTSSKSSSLSSSNNEIVESYKDFGEYLSTVYDCIDDYDDEDDSSRIAIEGTSLSSALSKARSNARLLVIFIPALTKVPKKGGKSNDQIAIQSLFSADVNVAAERKSRKKEKYGSFMFWSTKADSSEAMKAMKRLKIIKKSKNCPTLVVAYPAQIMDSSGRVKIVPKVLAQHHCNPPPSSSSMSSWLDALRKRHVKQYAAMHKDLREIAFMKERTEGYKSSVKQDQERVEEEAKEEARRLEEDRLKKEKEELLRERRKELMESLPEEPSTGDENVITIALRFSDGRTGQRRFCDDTYVDTLFDWVDAIFEVERELVILTTMNGKQTFSLGNNDNDTLSDVGLGKLVAFRVSVKETNENNGNNAEEKDEEE